MKLNELIKYLSEVDRIKKNIDIYSIDITRKYISIAVMPKGKELRFININLETKEITNDLICEAEDV